MSLPRDTSPVPRPPPPSLPPRSAKRNQTNSMVLLKLEGLETKKDTAFYAGKRVVFIYKTKSAKQGSSAAATVKNGSKFRTMWGRIGNPHGSNGLVKAKFVRNLPPKALGAPVRCMLYPSNV